MAAARAAQAPAAQQSVGASVSSPSRTHAQPISSGGNGSASRLYQQESTETTILGPTATNGPPAGSYQQTRPGTTASHATDPSDPRSYIPSTASENGSEFGEEEYEPNPDGSFQRDAQGRQIPYSSGSAGGPIPPDDIGDDDPLFAGGLGLDSIDALEIVVMLESEFGIRVRNETSARDNFRSVSALADFVEQRIAERAPQA